METIKDIVREPFEENGENHWVYYLAACIKASRARELADLVDASVHTKELLTKQIEAKDAENEKLRTLVGELADVLDWCNKQADSIGAASLLPIGFPMISLTMIMAAMSQRCNKIVAKAREVVK